MLEAPRVVGTTPADLLVHLSGVASAADAREGEAMRDELLELERRFWEASSAADGDFYRTQVTDDALYVFPGSTGVLNKDECAAVVEGNDTPWEWFEIDQPRFVQLGEGVALLTYTSRSQRGGAEPFSMRVSTVYRGTDDGWKLVFHQQTMAPSK
jgi:hypothetical protein